jgi:hypothetical protein
MTKKTAKPRAKPEAKTTEPEPTPPRAQGATLNVVVGGLPRFNFNARPTTNEEQRMTEPLTQSYESIQQEARGPGADEWRQVDKARSELSELYHSLQEDERYAPEYKSETAWKRYEETKAKIEQLAPEATRKMLKSAEGLERQSIPTPEGEGLITKDTDKLLLTAHERSRLEGLINRAEKAADKRPFKANPIDVLKAAYEQGLDEGGPDGGATVRAVVQLARDYGLDVGQIVDKHRKPHHHGALEDAQRRRIQADMVGRYVPEPPFKRGGVSPKDMGTYGSGAKAFIPQQKGMLFAPKSRRAPWK